MGLAASQARLLTLTSRKADLELDLTIYSSRKQALAREMQQLSSEYYSKLNNKQICFYANGKYNKINYNYLMGGTVNAVGVIQGAAYASQNGMPLKSNNLMVLTDYKGNVVLSKEYANIFAGVMGLADKTKGGACNPSNNRYAQMLNEICPTTSVEDYLKVLAGGYVPSSVNKANGGTVDNTPDQTNEIKNIINYYLPVFMAAAANGWTTEYEQYWTENDDYISDALVSGTLQLALIDPENGCYTTDDSLGYFITSGNIQTNSSSDTREAITAWYESEKLILTNKETYWDTEISNTSTELESVKTEIDSVKSFIDDEMSKFEWNT